MTIYEDNWKEEILWHFGLETYCIRQHTWVTDSLDRIRKDFTVIKSRLSSYSLERFPKIQTHSKSNSITQYNSGQTKGYVHIHNILVNPKLKQKKHQQILVGWFINICGLL